MLTIRPLTTRDAPQYQQLRISALQTSSQAFLNTFDSEQHFTLNRYLAEILYAHQTQPFGYYGAFDGEQLVGYVQIAPSGLDKQKHVAFIYNLYVDPPYRQQGTATTLVNHVINVLKQHQLELLLVNCVASNTSACRFYEKVGFEKYAERPNSVKWQDQYDSEVEFALKLKSIQ